MSKMTEQAYKKIATYVIFPLVFLLVIYYGYKIIDVALIKTIKGNIEIQSMSGETKDIAITKCFKSSDKSDPYKLIFSDSDSQNGIIFNLVDKSFNKYEVIFNGKVVIKQDCKLLENSLRKDEFAIGHNMSWGRISAYEGSCLIECKVDDMTIEYRATTHGCR
ncbi:MAG: hypothetical protein ACOYUZ_05815 [Patescibacteria group bacterium]